MKKKSTLRIINGIVLIGLLIILFSNFTNKWATILSILGVAINLLYLYKKQPDQKEKDSL